MEIKVTKYDDSLISGLDATQLKNYVQVRENYSNIPFKPKRDPI